MEAKEDAMVARNRNPPGANVQNGSGPSERAHNTENASVNAIFKKIMHLACSYVSGVISNASSKPKFAFELEKQEDKAKNFSPFFIWTGFTPFYRVIDPIARGKCALSTILMGQFPTFLKRNYRQSFENQGSVH